MANTGKAVHDRDGLQDERGASKRPDFRLITEPPVSAEEILYTRTRIIEVPRQVLRSNRVVSGFDPCFYTDAYKILSTHVSQKLRGNEWSTLAITSASRQEGKTLTAINLAISLASAFHQTALLVDADLWRPQVHEYFGLPPGVGLSDYLMSDMPIEDLLIHPGVPGFVFLPGGRPLANSSEALGWRRMAELVKELKSRYSGRIVVFDLPPLLHTADVLAFAPYVDAALLVIEEGRTARADVKRAQDMLTGTEIIGTVLNKSRETSVPREPSARGIKALFNRRD